MSENERRFVMVDEPGAFDPLETWESHLTDLKRLPKNTALRDEMIARAEQIIGERHLGNARPSWHPQAKLAFGRASIKAGRKHGDSGLVKAGRELVERAIAELASDEYLAYEMRGLGDEALAFAREHRKYLAENKPHMLAKLQRRGGLTGYLFSVGQSASEMFEHLLARKNADPEVQNFPYFEKVARMKAHQHEAEEVVRDEIIYQPRDDGPYED